MEEEGRPTREISSVMMTTSGFLSPAREGKLPESRSPVVAMDPLPTPRPASPAEQKVVHPLPPPEKRTPEGTKQVHRTPSTNKKKSLVKNIVKSKLKPLALIANNGAVVEDVKPPPVANLQHRFNETLEAARLKTERLNTTITPIVPHLGGPPQVPVPDTLQIEAKVDKLFTEPDKKKVNIFKKISNVKNEKAEKILKSKLELKRELQEPVIMDDYGGPELPGKIHHLSSDITIELINSPVGKQKTERMHFDNDSPPGTPSAPRTPEMIVQSPPQKKRRRKDKPKIKKVNVVLISYTEVKC